MDRLRELVGEYFDLGYAEGVAGRDTDTMAGDAQRVLSEINGHIEAAESRALSLEEEVKRLREALKPFAEYLIGMPVDLDQKGRPLPDDAGVGWAYLTVGDFRRARTTLFTDAGLQALSEGEQS